MNLYNIHFFSSSDHRAINLITISGSKFVNDIIDFSRVFLGGGLYTPEMRRFAFILDVVNEDIW